MGGGTRHLHVSNLLVQSRLESRVGGAVGGRGVAAEAPKVAGHREGECAEFVAGIPE